MFDIPYGVEVDLEVHFEARRSEKERAECTEMYMSTRVELQRSIKMKSEVYQKFFNKMVEESEVH